MRWSVVVVYVVTTCTAEYYLAAGGGLAFTGDFEVFNGCVVAFGAAGNASGLGGVKEVQQRHGSLTDYVMSF